MSSANSNNDREKSQYLTTYSFISHKLGMHISRLDFFTQIGFKNSAAEISE